MHPTPSPRRFRTTALITFLFSPLLVALPYVIAIPFGDVGFGLFITMFSSAIVAGYPIGFIGTGILWFIASRYFKTVSRWGILKVITMSGISGLAIVGVLAALVGLAAGPGTWQFGIVAIAAIPPAILMTLFYRHLLLR
ncbi:MAG: hypothetical protein ACPG1C_04920 [Alphaproteobacteria bacterium]